MSSEDVYDNPRWCNVCQTNAHSECEPRDLSEFLDFHCAACDVLFSDDWYYEGHDLCPACDAKMIDSLGRSLGRVAPGSPPKGDTT